MKRPFGTGTTPGIGGATNHGYLPLTNWDDPPSDQFCFDVAMICLFPLKESLAIPLTCFVFKFLPELPLFTDAFAVQKDPRKCSTLCNQKSKYLLQFQLFTNQKIKNKLTKQVRYINFPPSSKTNLASWWFFTNPFEKYATVKFGFIFPRVGDENKQVVEVSPPSKKKNLPPTCRN